MENINEGKQMTEFNTSGCCSFYDAVKVINNLLE